MQIEAEEQLHEIQPLLEEALQHLGNPVALKTWLLTPVTSGGKKPVEYLLAQDYMIFRGFLLHIRTGQEMFQPPKPLGLVYLKRPREEVEHELERLRPGAWRYDDDTDDNEP